MKDKLVYKFYNRDEIRKLNMWIIVIAVIFLQLPIFFNSKEIRLDIMLILSILGLVYSIINYRLNRIGVEEVIINGDSIKIYFYSKKRVPIIFNKKDYLFNLRDGKLKIESDGKLIGIAKKSQLEYNEKWDEFIRHIMQ